MLLAVAAAGIVVATLLAEVAHRLSGRGGGAGSSLLESSLLESSLLELAQIGLLLAAVLVLLALVIHSTWREAVASRRLLTRQAALEALTGGAPLSGMLATVMRAIEAARPDLPCAVLVREPGGATTTLASTPGLPDDYVARLIDLAAEPGEGVVIADARREALPEDLRTVARRAGMRAIWVGPVIDAAGEALGHVVLQRRRPGRPGRRDIEHLIESTRLVRLVLDHWRSEEKMRQQTHILALGQELAQMGSFVFDPVSGAVETSGNWRAHLGFDADTPLTVDDIFALIPLEDHPLLWAADEKHRRGEPAVIDHRNIQRHTGKVLHVRSCGVQLTDEQGRPGKIVGSVQDVTDLKQVTLALKASEARFRDLFEATPLKLAVWRLARDDFVLESINRASVAFGGTRIIDLIGIPLSEFYADQPWMCELVRGCHEKGEGVQVERLYRFRSTGEARHLNLKFAPLPPDTVLVIAEDIDARIRTEHRLRETAERLTEAEVLAGIGAWEWDVRPDVWSFSDNWCRLHGVETPPRTTEALLTLVFPDDLDKVESALDSALEGGACEVTHRVVDPGSGAIRVMKMRGTPVLDDAGQVIRVRGMVLDITARERDEKALRETTELMVAGQRLGRMGSFEYDLNSGQWSLSETWQELSGWSPPPATTEELLTWIHPDDQETVRAGFQAMLRGENRRLEHRVIHVKSGETLQLRSFGMLIHDDHGRPARLRGLVQDVTEEKRREAHLADNLMRLAMAQQIARIGSASVDPRRRRSEWSAEMYRIFERDPALGPPCLGDHADLYAPRDYAALRDAFDAAIKQGTPFDLTFPLHMPGGRTKWVHVLGRPASRRGPAGHVVHATVQDITERKRAEEFREDMERIMRHDLRSPIAATSAGINILRMADTLTDDQRQTLDMMELSTRRQLSLLDLSMALYRMEAGTFDPASEAVDLGAVLGEVRGELAHLAGNSAATVRLEARGRPVAVGDPWLCRTLFTNLVRNAIEALPGPGLAVTIDLASEAGRAVVRITNPGEVPPAIRDRFFEKYATSGKAGGTGLGTYSARLMARAQGGALELDTSTPGQTTLTVTLPLADAAVSPA
ncbi:PAS domain-containing sensor histidine kinase [Roseospirillum parvum]|uniref:histidine kinase n=1 Tax=Roseospirillum parvum TaxID=83401 RepID=A0A1G8AQ35_9PROT|nr:PAS domain-containing protein [Roseospirillum parvum]SDH23162.1 PAS domain S-box-containing protein [Roseospirillum parvum]